MMKRILIYVFCCIFVAFFVCQKINKKTANIRHVKVISKDKVEASDAISKNIPAKFDKKKSNELTATQDVNCSVLPESRPSYMQLSRCSAVRLKTISIYCNGQSWLLATVIEWQHAQRSWKIGLKKRTFFFKFLKT